ncbi:MAG: FAD-binding oxidoreductase [Gemmatimonadetes bacterium]|nr:FAD-binding oxidoreductase [Gemmatimonadota bacterium]
MNDDIAEKLATSVRGRVVTPGDQAYDDARSVYNAMIDRRPQVVVQAQDEADVLATVRAAREAGLVLAVRGGGHSVPGYGTCDDGVVLDLSAIHNVFVDPREKTARIGGGALLRELDHATHAFGLATPAGFFSSTGVGGLTVGGGLGPYLSRRFGLTCDNMLSAQVVTADGRLVTASEEENPDLFWALRGGGGNFGVVTSFEFKLHPVDQVVGGPIFYELDAAADVMRFFRDHFMAAPRELSGFFAFQIAPPLPFIPEARHGDTLCALVVCWSGDPAEAERVLKPIRAAGPVVAEHVGPMPYPVLQSAFDALVPAGLRHYWKSDFVRSLPEEAVETHMEHGPSVPTMTSTMHLYLSDGAVHDVPPDATAFAHRDAGFVMNVIGVWEDAADDSANTAWVRGYYDAIHPYSGFEGGYTNFMAEDDMGRVKESYGASYEKLRQVKRAWDPDNVFHLNQNVVPAK